MWFSGVIEPLDVCKDRIMQFLQGMIGSSVGFFFFEIFEKTLTYSIIKGITLFREGLYNIR